MKKIRRYSKSLEKFDKNNIRNIIDEKCSYLSVNNLRIVPLPELIDCHYNYNNNHNHNYNNRHELLSNEMLKNISLTNDNDSIDKIKSKFKPVHYLKILFKLSMIIIIVLITSISYLYFDSFLNNAIESQFNFEPNNRITKFWQYSSQPYTMKFYLFGLKNPVNFIRGETPILIEYGPFIYHVLTNRTVTKWKSETIEYTKQSFYQFDRSQSIPMETELAILNYPLLTALYLVKSMINDIPFSSFLSPIVQNLVQSVMRSSGEKIIMRLHAFDLLEGYNVKFFKYVKRLIVPMKALGIKFDPEFEQIDFNNFIYGYGPQSSGQISKKNENFRRTENNHLFNGLYKIDGQKKVPYFRPPCNQINSPSNLYFGMHLKSNKISFFNHNVCCKIRLIRNYTHYHRSFLKVVRYTVDTELFNPKIKSNQCYCFQSKLSQCHGWIDTTPCLGKLQIASSFPHFYNSKKRQQSVKGMQPEYQKHIGFLDIEPNIGIPINGRVAMQSNIRLTSAPIIGLQSIPDTILPMFWAEQSNQIQSPMFYSLMFISLCFDYGKNFIIFLGLFIIIILFYRIVRRK